MLHAKRLLYLVHRWLGIVVCTFFAMWFVSGVVMMYVGYPKLTSEERLAHLPALDPARDYLTPTAALAAAGVAGPLDDLRLAASSRGRAVYLAVPSAARAPGARRGAPGEGTIVIDALTGQRLAGVDASDAMASAAAFARQSLPAAAYRGTIAEDAFTHSRALDAHRPLHVVDVGDAQGTRLYVSGTTAEVVRDAPRNERLWNYAGAWIHWLYPFRGNFFDRWWSDIVNGLSIVGIAVTVTGTVVGLWRWRFAQPYRSGSRSPYPGRMMRWHHVFGLLFALITFTWIFSGLMSMNPWRVLDGGAPALRTDAMNGGKLRVSARFASPRLLLAAGPAPVKELRWVRSAGHDLVIATSGAGAALTLAADSGRPFAFERAALDAAIARLSAAPLERVELLTAYDLYYYSRAPHTMTGGTDKPLPVLRAVFADGHGTWVHVDPATGLVINRVDDMRRVGRWVFAMLHSWDWLPLLDLRPLWDIVLIVLSAGGLALSATGLVIGARRLSRKGRQLRHAAAHRVAGSTERIVHES